MASQGLFTSRISGGTPVPTAQEMADRIQAEARAAMPRTLFRPPPPRPAPLTPTGDMVAARLAEELAYVRRILDGVGDVLASDGVVAMRYASTLQQFDVMGQMLGHLGNVLNAEDREEAIDRIGMGSLKARLQR